ncbi:MAG: redox-sensing transcriptional repressor Rex, partial [Planctomycetes bacterium]|nr:redox-sensing transcriptional repressor Rex [Planctomycetota bacterium]
GCMCYHSSELAKIVKEKNITLGIITVPATAAQKAADELAAAGVRGMLNFAPVRIRVPQHVYVEDLDVTMSLEKVAYYAHRDNE